jgi:hypothetical protein
MKDGDGFVDTMGQLILALGSAVIGAAVALTAKDAAGFWLAAGAVLVLIGLGLSRTSRIPGGVVGWAHGRIRRLRGANR